MLTAADTKVADDSLEYKMKSVHFNQGLTKTCRLSWLTNSALVYEPKYGGRGVAGSQPMSTAVHRSPNKLWNGFHVLYFLSERAGRGKQGEIQKR
jgi:hypothetical protein